MQTIKNVLQHFRMQLGLVILFVLKLIVSECDVDFASITSCV